jgi:hypothetical protein
MSSLAEYFSAGVEYRKEKMPVVGARGTWLGKDMIE